jgi:endonuclease G
LGSLVLALIVCFGVLALADRNYGSVHLLLGNPSQATLVSTNASNYLMLKPEYALSYNRARGLPNWVSWQLNATWLGTHPAKITFVPIPPCPLVGTG